MFNSDTTKFYTQVFGLQFYLLKIRGVKILCGAVWWCPNLVVGKRLWDLNAIFNEVFFRPCVLKKENISAIIQNGRLIRANNKVGTIIKEFNFKKIIRSPITMSSDLLFIPTIQKKFTPLI